MSYTISLFKRNVLRERELNKNFPHRCFKCKKPLYFDDLWISNCNSLSDKKFTKEELEKLWKSPYVQFLCCDCYEKEE